MTSVASIGAVTTIGLTPPATGVTRAGDPPEIAATPASTTVTLGQGTAPALTYTSQPASVGVVWEREASDKVSSVIAETLSARTLAGRLEGVATRHFENGFASTIGATMRKRDKLAAQLTWLANRHLLASPEDRRHGRYAPRNPMTMLIMPNGVNIGCRLIDVSLSGAAVATDQRPPMGALVTIGKVQGRVVRHLDDGFAVEFVRLQHPDFLEESVTVG